ncbi:unnamed protein product, partial [Polarella glacialis]
APKLLPALLSGERHREDSHSPERQPLALRDEGCERSPSPGKSRSKSPDRGRMSQASTRPGSSLATSGRDSARSCRSSPAEAPGGRSSRCCVAGASGALQRLLRAQKRQAEVANNLIARRLGAETAKGGGQPAPGPAAQTAQAGRALAAEVEATVPTPTLPQACLDTGTPEPLHLVLRSSNFTNKFF